MNLIAFNRLLIFKNKIKILETSFFFDVEKNMLNRTQVCNLEIWIEETFTLLKEKGIITENMLLSKYQKQQQQH